MAKHILCNIMLTETEAKEIEHAMFLGNRRGSSAVEFLAHELNRAVLNKDPVTSITYVSKEILNGDHA